MGVKEAKGKKVSKKSAKSDSTVDIAKVRPYHIIHHMYTKYHPCHLYSFRTLEGESKQGRRKKPPNVRMNPLMNCQALKKM